MTKHWRRLTPPPTLTFEENGRLVKEDGRDRFPITLNAVLRVANSDLKDGDPFDPDTVARWLGAQIPLTFERRRYLLDTLPQDDRELLYFAIQTLAWQDIVRVARVVLDQIVERNKGIAETSEFSTYSNRTAETVARARRASRAIYAGRSYLSISEDGVLAAVADPVLLLFHGMANTERIRRCEICQNFYWAGRITAKCCSARCNNTRIKRNSRAPEAKQRARENKKYLRELKAKKRARRS